MLVVETIAKIRRASFQDKKSIKQICRELRVSRNTVRKAIRSATTELTYERTIQPLPKIGPWMTARRTPTPAFSAASCAALHGTRHLRLHLEHILCEPIGDCYAFASQPTGRVRP